LTAEPLARPAMEKTSGPKNQVLSIEHLSKTYVDGKSQRVALADVSLRVGQGEFVSVVGPSGCGKTTLLMCAAGLLRPSSGTITLDGAQVIGPPPGLAVVFQDYSRSLFPWFTVAQNVALPLKALGVAAKLRAQRVAEALDAVGLAGASQAHPYQLSGGMQQRVAIARALAYQPRLLLMDEPFASLDAQTRIELEDLLLRTASDFHMSVLFVTHDIDEAVYLADRIVVLSRSPTIVRDTLQVDLPSPRDQIGTKSMPTYLDLRAQTFKLVRS
jgi:NitT/TauT family transport system ATP-binding protein